MKNIVKILTIFIIFVITFIIFVTFSKNNSKQNTSYAASSHASDVQLMARAINGEARGEPYEGQVAVGAVILNRVKDSRFPNSISGVIYQSGAFTAVADGQINAPIDEDSTDETVPSTKAVYLVSKNLEDNKQDKASALFFSVEEEIEEE